MTQNEFYELKERAAESQLPFRLVDRAAIKYIGRFEDNGNDGMPLSRNLYSVMGTEVLATDNVAKTLDEMSGLRSDQKEIVGKARGEEGVKDLRNYLASASTIANPSKVALIADPERKAVVNVIPVKDSLITSDDFFDFAEMFMDQNNMFPTEYELGGSLCSGVTLHMGSNVPDVRTVTDGEDFLMNSYFLRWNLGQIELGRYYERLVCSNGQTEAVHQVESKMLSLDERSIKNMLALPRDEAALNNSFERLREHALTAINTRASLSELGFVHKLLSRYMVGTERMKELAPYNEVLNYYQQRGFGKEGLRPHETLASMTVWDLYNGVTAYASHNTDWHVNDNRRSGLQGAIYNFLLRPRDIKNYVDAYQ